ncbi:MAG: hypothetical protein AVDCRST_MAG71-1914, partial [uncultured Lysobacter sp.]
DRRRTPFCAAQDSVPAADHTRASLGSPALSPEKTDGLRAL